MKKKVIIIILSIILIACCVCVYGYIRLGWFHKASYQDKVCMETLERYNTDILIYGNIKKCREIQFDYRVITEITPETIDNGKENYYHAVILMDRDGKMDLSDEELILLREYCETKYYDMLYYGTEHLEQLKRCGYFTVLDDSDFCIWYNGYYYRDTGVPQDTEDVIYLNPFLVTGCWEKEDEEDMGSSTYPLWKSIIEILCYSLEH